ncbi:MAG: sigma-70 family RNA polymerase sigma factor [Bacteroidales bacterium]|nr:sigma-70 family RNA polymerase sigma factor [Bacteroidales bacterium]
MGKTGLKRTDLTDKELIELALADDQGAFSMLLSRYGKPLKSHVMNYVKVEADAEDICQRSFEKAFRDIGSYNKKYAFSTWLYTIAQNEAIDHLRRNRSTISSISLETPGVLSLSGDSTPEDRVMEDQAVAELLTFIDRLPATYKTIAEYRFIRDYAYEDIADELSIPLGTVKTRINRARKMLIAMVENKVDNGND